MKFSGRIIRSKETKMFGRILRVQYNRVFITFNRNDDEGICLTYKTFLRLCECDEEVSDELMKRLGDDI